MAVRVKIRVHIIDKQLDTIALVNSGFETDEPQLLVPDRFLSLNGVDTTKLKGSIIEYGTPAGPVSLYVARKCCRASIIEPDRETKSVTIDLVVSPVEREVLISDSLGEELGIIILSLKKGLWKLNDDPPEKIRNSYQPQYW